MRQSNDKKKKKKKAQFQFCSGDIFTGYLNYQQLSDHWWGNCLKHRAANCTLIMGSKDYLIIINETSPVNNLRVCCLFLFILLKIKCACGSVCMQSASFLFFLFFYFLVSGYYFLMCQSDFIWWYRPSKTIRHFSTLNEAHIRCQSFSPLFFVHRISIESNLLIKGGYSSSIRNLFCPCT